MLIILLDNNIELKNIVFLNNLIKLFNNNLFSIKVNNNNNYVSICYKKNNFLLSFIKILQKCSFFRYESLIDICCVDLLNLKQLKELNKFRFQLNYIMSSYYYCNYITISIFIDNISNEYKHFSINSIFSSSVWIEREIWEMFGIYFFNNKDLRRLLTDYSFIGYPLRKDYPLSGYIDVRYDDSINTIVYESVILNQAFRAFNFQNPWLSIKKQNDK